MLRTKILTGAALSVAMAAPALAGDVEWFPPDPPASAASGECYARVRIPAEYDSYSEQITVADGFESYEVSPPRLRPEVREYISREAGMRYIVHEPVYETITETVQIRPAYTEYVVRPAEHETVTETIMVREPRTVWRRGYEPGALSTRVDEETGEIWCLVEEPGEYRTVTRTIVTRPADVEEISYPAEYSTITREVLVQEARVEEVPIPAQYAEYRIEVLDQAATIDSYYSEERTDTITRYTLRSNERYEWRLVDCDDLDIPAYGEPPVASRQPMASQAPAMTATPRSYIYGTDAVAGDQADEDIPVAQARSYSRSRN